MEKSTILPRGRMEDPSSLAMELGCNIGLLPTSYYLGLPLGAGHNSTQIWDYRGENSEEVSSLEKTIYLQRRKNYPYPNHSF